MLGVEQFGTYTFAMAWASILVIPASMGLNTLVVREIAIHTSRAEWGMARGLLRWSNRVSLSLGVVLALGGAALGWYLLNPDTPYLQVTFAIAMIMVPLEALSKLREGTLRALHKVVLGQVPEALFRPMLFLLLLGGGYLLMDGHVPVDRVMALAAIASGAAFLFGAWLLVRNRPQELVTASPHYQPDAWIKTMVPLMVLAGAQVFSGKADIVMLGAMADLEAVGIYSVARRGSELVLFGLTAVNTVLAPVVAQLYATDQRQKLQAVITKSTRIVLLFSATLAAVLVVFGDLFLGLFGEQFIAGHTALIILCFATLVNAAMGSVGTLLVMSGKESVVPKVFWVSAILNVALNALWIPIWGINGAAAATAISMIFWNVVLMSLVRTRMGIDATALGLRLHGKGPND